MSILLKMQHIGIILRSFMELEEFTVCVGLSKEKKIKL